VHVMNFSSLASLLLALTVGFGAFGAHALKARFDAYQMDVWEKAVYYQFVHALGMLIASLFERSGALASGSTAAVCWLFLAGIVFFSGSLYALALSGVATLGAVTPIGGVAFIAAWVLLAIRLAKPAG